MSIINLNVDGNNLRQQVVMGAPEELVMQLTLDGGSQKLVLSMWVEEEETHAAPASEPRRATLDEAAVAFARLFFLSASGERGGL